MKRLMLLLAVLTTACAIPGERAALIVEPTAISRAELLSSVRTALNNAQILLADAALTQDSMLVIERAPHNDPRGLPANGRELQQPERFLLFVQGDRCVLLHERTGQRWQLAHTRCVAR